MYIRQPVLFLGHSAGIWTLIHYRCLLLYLTYEDLTIFIFRKTFYSSFQRSFISDFLMAFSKYRFATLHLWKCNFLFLQSLLQTEYYMPIYFVKGCWTFLDDLFWSNVFGILFQKIKKQKILTRRNCTNWYYVVSIVFVLDVVSRVNSYVHIISDTRTLVLCTNYFWTEVVTNISLPLTRSTLIKKIYFSTFFSVLPIEDVFKDDDDDDR